MSCSSPNQSPIPESLRLSLRTNLFANVRLQLVKAFAASLLLIAFLASTLANDWQTIRNCRLMENESNDGDSFHVEADGEERIFRLYFVDAPESESGGYVTKRVAEQAELFGITEEESVEMGKKAAAFTCAVLSRPFTVTTRGQRAMGQEKDLVALR